MKENRILFFLFVALLVVAFFALQSFNKWKKIIQEYPLLREEQRRFILTEGKVSDNAKKALEDFGKDKYEMVLMSENRDLAVKRLDFLKKSPGYNSILFSVGTLDKWRKENS